MDWKITIGVACATPGVLLLLTYFARWAWANPKKFGEEALITLVALAMIGIFVGVCFIAAIWWPWWALPTALFVLGFFVIIAMIMDA